MTPSAAIRRALRGGLVALALGACCLAAPARAQVSAELELHTDREQVQVGEMLRLTVQAHVSGDSAQNLQLPDLRAFDVIQRQVVNPFSLGMRLGGAPRHVESRTRHSLVLRAREPGTHTIGPARITAGGRDFESNTVTVVVGGSGAAGTDPAGAPDPASALPPSTSHDGMQFDPQGFIRTWVDHGEPYLGQQVTVTVYLYSREPLRGSPTITQEPSTEGFWTRDLLPPSRTLDSQRQALNGQHFNVYVLRRFAAFPLQTGQLTIGPTTLTVTRGGIFGGIFGGGNAAPFTRTGVPVTVDVQPLPEAGQPDGEVHVGTLSLAAELDRAQAPTGDAVTLTVTATGHGPIEQVRVPTPAADGLRVLEPEIRDEVTIPNDVVGGTRTYRWLIVPERPGDYTLGPFEVPVFDPRTATYSVARAEALTLTAAGNAAAVVPPDDEDAAEATAPDADPIRELGPIRTRSALSRTHAPLASRPWFLALLALGPLAFGGALAFRSARRRAAQSDPRHAPRRAKKSANKRLQAAKEHARAGEAREFYAAVSTALKEVLEAKLGRPVGSLTHTELRKLLQRRGMTEETAETIVDELEGCDFARFSAVGVSEEEMERCLRRMRELVTSVDRFAPTEEEAA